MLNNDYNFASYQAKFTTYLREQKYPENAVKSALADLEHFFTWAATQNTHKGFRLSDQNNLDSVFNYGALRQYETFCSRTESAAIFKRRLSALRGFSELAVSEEWLQSNIFQAFQLLADNEATMLKRSQNLLSAFSDSLEQSGQNKNTLRGYLADVEEYLQITSSI